MRLSNCINFCVFMRLGPHSTLDGCNTDSKFKKNTTSKEFQSHIHIISYPQLCFINQISPNIGIWLAIIGTRAIALAKPDDHSPCVSEIGGRNWRWRTLKRCWSRSFGFPFPSLCKRLQWDTRLLNLKSLGHQLPTTSLSTRQRFPRFRFLQHLPGRSKCQDSQILRPPCLLTLWGVEIAYQKGINKLKKGWYFECHRWYYDIVLWLSL